MPLEAATGLFNLLIIFPRLSSNVRWKNTFLNVFIHATAAYFL